MQLLCAGLYVLRSVLYTWLNGIHHRTLVMNNLTQLFENLVYIRDVALKGLNWEYHPNVFSFVYAIPIMLFKLRP